MKMQIFPISTQMGTTNLVVEARLCSERKTAAQLNNSMHKCEVT